ncbi:MAG TPA: LamG domain-containing protein, partial [Kofleriaceae bacterium]
MDCAPLDAGPRDPLLGNVLTYTFDGDDSATEVIHDRSGNRLDGALEGGSVQLGGQYGLCVGDNGSGSPIVELPSHPLLHVGSALTLETWVYRTRIEIGEGLITIFDPVTQTGELIFEILPDDGLWFGIASGDCDAPTMQAVSLPAGTAPIGADEWVHVAVTWDGDHARFYKAGEEVYDDSLTATPCPSDRPLTLGATGSELLPLEGWLDDVKISSYAKTASEIQASAAHDPTVAGPRCGDSQVDEGEDCEPPAPCCDPATCLYAPVDCRCQECVVG